MAALYTCTSLTCVGRGAGDEWEVCDGNNTVVGFARFSNSQRRTQRRGVRNGVFRLLRVLRVFWTRRIGTRFLLLFGRNVLCRKRRGLILFRIKIHRDIVRIPFGIYGSVRRSTRTCKMAKVGICVHSVMWSNKWFVPQSSRRTSDVFSAELRKILT